MAMIYNNILDINFEKNNVPIIIPTHDNPTYMNNTVNFFKNKNHDFIIVLDNNSKTEKMIDALNNLDSEIYTILQKNNCGPRQILNDNLIWNALPNIFILTDPDLGFSKDFPNNFCEELIEISNIYSAGKVGSALNIDILEPNVIDDIFFINGSHITIRGVEEPYFFNYVGEYNNSKIYEAPIDTTFALYNKSHSQKSLRVAGKYLAEHYGWYKNPPIPQSEIYDYLSSLEQDVISLGGLTETVKRYERYTR